MDYVREQLLNNELSRIVAALISEYKPLKIILFGSCTTGRIDSYSDLDLLVIKESNKDFYERLEEVALLVKPRIAADIIVYTPAEATHMQESSPFVKEIFRKGKVAYDAETSASMAMGYGHIERKESLKTSFKDSFLFTRRLPGLERSW